MFSRTETSQLKKEFWTAFGLYMKPVPFAEGEKNNWINYKTGEKNIAFKMDADNKSAIISIEINHSDPELQELYFEQLKPLKKLLEEALNETWAWQLHHTEETGRIISRIYCTQSEVNIFNKTDWPALISFFKTRIIALDAFWSQAKYAFEALR